MIETEELEQLIRNTIEDYRSERGFFGGSGMTDRDQTNLVHRIKDAMTEKLERIDRREVTRLRRDVEQMEREVRLASGSQYGELRQEYEAMKSICKNLIYQMGKEDESVIVYTEDMVEMERRVDLDWMEEDGKVMLKVQEIDES